MASTLLRTCRTRSLVVALALLPLLAGAQTRHELRPSTELGILGVGIGFHGFSLWQHQRHKDLGLPSLEGVRIPMIDRVATRQWHPAAHRASNVLFGFTAAACLGTTLLQQQGQQPLVPVVILFESAFLSAGITNTVKELVRRPRPYLHNPDVPVSAYRPGEDALSFWSGHTAHTAALTFSCASLVQRSDASPGVKTATWIGAALAPATMGYLRVRAGKHYPTDVISGYLVGAAVGILVPALHRTRERH